MKPIAVASVVLGLLIQGGALAGQSTAGAPSSRQDASKEEIALPAGEGWYAHLVYENDVGIWTCGALDAFEKFGALDAFGLDDKGRCILLSSYSGKWTPSQTVEDKEWLGSFSHLKLDPRRLEREIYTGGKRGNLYQIVVHDDGTLDTARIAAFPGEEIHTSVGGDLDPSRAGNELLAFTHAGSVYEIRPRKDGHAFDAPRIATLRGRVRQALILPAPAGAAPWIAGVCRTGEVLLLRLGPNGLESKEILREEMGFGRIARRKSGSGEPIVLYVTRDDGVILRLESKDGMDGWIRESIYAGPQGPRGIAAGRFDADPAVETVAVFGYSTRVELLSRRGSEPWRVSTIFQDRDKGHWLETVEVDGRNATDELFASGYGSRIVALSRPPGYGRPEPLPNPKPENGEHPAAAAPAKASGAEIGGRAVRVAVRGRAVAPETLSPLTYRGGFEPKTLIYETLVRVDERGEIAPGLASSWQVAPDGKSIVLELRDGARFHDGTAVDAEAVRLHFKRWLGLPEHAWLRAARHVVDVVPEGRQRVRLVLDRPAAVLVDLCAINPCSIRGPGALDKEGNPVQPIGSGSYRCAGATEDERVLRFELSDSSSSPSSPGSTRSPLLAKLDLVRMADATPGSSVAALLAGEVDVVADGWYELLPRDGLESLRTQPGIAVESFPGSSVWSLGFHGAAGSTADVRLRRRIARAIDRDELVARVEAGHADPCASWAAPTIGFWPRSVAPASLVRSFDEVDRSASAASLRLIVRSGSWREAELARALTKQLEGNGLAVAVRALDAAGYSEALERGEFDLKLDQTWGVPYDPWLSLFHRFLPEPESRFAATANLIREDERLVELVQRASEQTDPAALAAFAAPIQERIDHEALLVPLYVPRRLAAVRADRARVDLDHDLYRLRVVAPSPDRATALR